MTSTSWSSTTAVRRRDGARRSRRCAAARSRLLPLPAKRWDPAQHEPRDEDSSRRRATTWQGSSTPTSSFPRNLVDAVDAAFARCRARHPSPPSPPGRTTCPPSRFRCEARCRDSPSPTFVSDLSRALARHQRIGDARHPDRCRLLPVAPPTRSARSGSWTRSSGAGYCEEVDWCQRARLAGYRNVLSPGFVRVSTRAVERTVTRVSSPMG